MTENPKGKCRYGQYYDRVKAWDAGPPVPAEVHIFYRLRCGASGICNAGDMRWDATNDFNDIVGFAPFVFPGFMPHPDLLPPSKDLGLPPSKDLGLTDTD